MNISLLSELLGIPQTSLTTALGLGRTLRLVHKIPREESTCYINWYVMSGVKTYLWEDRQDWVLKTAGRVAEWLQKLKRNFADLQNSNPK